MFSILLYLHVIGAVLLGSFIVFPFLMKRLGKLEHAAQSGFLTLLLSFSRVAHFALILVLASGIAMVGTNHSAYSMVWVTISLLLLLLIGAMMGIITKRLKGIHKDSLTGTRMSGDSRLQTFSWICALGIIIVLFVMTNPALF